MGNFRKIFFFNFFSRQKIFGRKNLHIKGALWVILEKFNFFFFIHGW